VTTHQNSGRLDCCDVFGSCCLPQMFTVTPHAVLESVGAADANQDASFPKVIDFFAAEPEPARELFAGDEVGLGTGHMACRGDRTEVAGDLGLG
jgi:hypothetical protein